MAVKNLHSVDRGPELCRVRIRGDLHRGHSSNVSGLGSRGQGSKVKGHLNGQGSRAKLGRRV
eukprot:970526-Rhodomonas_salina.5